MAFFYNSFFSYHIGTTEATEYLNHIDGKTQNFAQLFKIFNTINRLYITDLLQTTANTILFLISFSLEPNITFP